MSSSSAFDSFLAVCEQREALSTRLEAFLRLVNKYDILFESALPGAELVFALPHICAALLHHPSRYTRSRLVACVKAMGAAGAPALPALLELCSHRDWYYGDAAREAIQSIIADMAGQPSAQDAARALVTEALQAATQHLEAAPALMDAIAAETALPPRERERLLSHLRTGNLLNASALAGRLRHTAGGMESAALLARIEDICAATRQQEELAQVCATWEAPTEEILDPASLLDALQAWGTAHREVVAQIYLYGSRYRGDHRADSDLDIAVVLHPPGGTAALDRWGTMRERLASSLQERVPVLTVDLQLLVDATLTPEVYRGVQVGAQRIDLDMPLS